MLSRFSTLPNLNNQICALSSQFLSMRYEKERRENRSESIEMGMLVIKALNPWFGRTLSAPNNHVSFHVKHPLGVRRVIRLFRLWNIDNLCILGWSSSPASSKTTDASSSPDTMVILVRCVLAVDFAPLQKSGLPLLDRCSQSSPPKENWQAGLTCSGCMLILEPHDTWRSKPSSFEWLACEMTLLAARFGLSQRPILSHCGTSTFPGTTMSIGGMKVKFSGSRAGS